MSSGSRTLDLAAIDALTNQATIFRYFAMQRHCLRVYGGVPIRIVNREIYFDGEVSALLFLLHTVIYVILVARAASRVLSLK